jgi:hypothetical protein
MQLLVSEQLLLLGLHLVLQQLYLSQLAQQLLFLLFLQVQQLLLGSEELLLEVELKIVLLLDLSAIVQLLKLQTSHLV